MTQVEQLIATRNHAQETLKRAAALSRKKEGMASYLQVCAAILSQKNSQITKLDAGEMNLLFVLATYGLIEMELLAAQIEAGEAVEAKS